MRRYGPQLLVLLLICLSGLPRWTEAEFTVLFHHKLSHQAKEQHFARRLGEWPYPEPNTFEYQKFLLEHDFQRHGRQLASTGSYTFSEGNFTLQLFGGLYYATIDVGTPPVPFLVALDTGSDLFWLPCECESCAPTRSPVYEDYGITAPLNTYAPSNSSTSAPLSCASEECHIFISQCPPTSNSACQYEVNYASVNTSSSGRLVEDVVHLVPNSGEQLPTTVPIVVGCGQVQTGSFLTGFGAPDGLIGLGLQNYSVPASLAKSGLVSDSFSMCMGVDGSGRIVFGDIGSPQQFVTPFIPRASTAYDTYYIGIEGFNVGADNIEVGQTALFDTGTTYTFLNSSAYRPFVDSFVRQVTQYERIPDGSQDVGPWEACYLTTESTVTLPSIEFVLSGNVSMAIQFPVIPLIYTNQTQAGFCLAVLEATDSIIGANFMVGFNLVFNRAERTLGFQEADCYQVVPNSGPATPGGEAPEGGLEPPAAGGPSVSPPGEVDAPPNGPANAPSKGAVSSVPSSVFKLLLSLALVLFLS